MKEHYKQALQMEISPFHVHLAEYLCSKFAGHKPDMPDMDREKLFWLLIHLAVQAGNGHIRTSLESIARDALNWCNSPEILNQLEKSLHNLVKIGIQRQLIGCLSPTLPSADSFPITRPPLLLTADGKHLYFLRRRREEDCLITFLRTRCVGTVDSSQYSAAHSPAETLATMIADGQRLILLSGGPGTGKTTAISQLLSILPPSLRIFLTAPTGRAASRLAESIPDRTGYTLHRLLGLYPNRPPKHNRNNPLNADLIVVDEASMIDLPLMNTLLNAIKPDTRLLLSGDPDQLPSIEAGAVFGDLLAGNRRRAAESKSGPLSGCTLELNTVFRSNKQILNAASAIRNGSLEELRVAVDGKAVILNPLPHLEEAVKYIAGVFGNNPGKTDVMTCLCPLRNGHWGTLSLNERISRYINGTAQPFEGMPIVITRNDPELDIWNGDKAVLRRKGSGTNSSLQVVFPGTVNNPERQLPLAVISAWEPAWVITVHKSQGSEFESILLIFPEGADKSFTREMIYTAITRARTRVEILADEVSLERALQNRTVRNSGIRDWAAGIEK